MEIFGKFPTLYKWFYRNMTPCFKMFSICKKKFWEKNELFDIFIINKKYEQKLQ